MKTYRGVTALYAPLVLALMVSACADGGNLVGPTTGPSATYHPSPESCGECKGGVIELTLRNNGPAGVIRVVSETVIFEGYVESGGEFTLYGDRKDGKLKKEIEVYRDGAKVTSIHTSCSKPIGPGALWGPFEVVSAVSDDNGTVCPVYTSDNCQECKGGVIELTLRNDGPGGVVRVISESVVFEGYVATGGELTVRGDRKEGKLKKEIELYLDGVQVVTIHTSCSKPIGPGTVWGSFEVLEAISADNGPICPVCSPTDDEPDYDPSVPS